MSNVAFPPSLSTCPAASGPDRGPVAFSERPCGLAATATASPKGLNQDASATARRPGDGLCLAVVADGIGSHPRAEVGAALAVGAVVHRFLAVGESRLPALFVEAAEAVGVAGEAERIDPKERDKQLGTTLLCALETPDEVRIGYVGNGAILHLRPPLLGARGLAPAPWAATNLLSPHSVPHNGKNVLSRFLSAEGPGPRSEPTVLSLRKDARHGDIVCLCTDGFWSADQLTYGSDDRNQVWQLSEPALHRLLSSLSSWVASGDLTEESLGAALASLLAALAEESLLEDDCTVAVLVSAEAVRFLRG